VVTPGAFNRRRSSPKKEWVKRELSPEELAEAERQRAAAAKLPPAKPKPFAGEGKTTLVIAKGGGAGARDGAGSGTIIEAAQLIIALGEKNRAEKVAAKSRVLEQTAALVAIDVKATTKTLIEPKPLVVTKIELSEAEKKVVAGKIGGSKMSITQHFHEWEHGSIESSLSSKDRQDLERRAKSGQVAKIVAVARELNIPYAIPPTKRSNAEG
jgi:hypothetical protein